MVGLRGLLTGGQGRDESVGGNVVEEDVPSLGLRPDPGQLVEGLGAGLGTGGEEAGVGVIGGENTPLLHLQAEKSRW